jgi:hypothetical protein
VHPLFLMVNQIAEGKTNHGWKLYGRATQHRFPEFCAISAFAFYLMGRFYATREFDDFTVEDWCDNSKWFDIKILADVGATDWTQPIKNDKYSKHIKAILTKIGICTDHLCHLGWKLGSKFLELLEEESEDVRKMGQWSPSVYDTHYSTKFLLGAI